MVADGGCAESLNVQVDDQELAPMLAPRDVTGRKTGLDVLAYRPVYIHKAQGMENYFMISQENEVRVATKDGYVAEEDFKVSLGDETYRCASSNGNTVMLHTDRHTHYVLLKDGAYRYLGTRVPKPVVKFSRSSTGTVVNVNPSSFTSLPAKELVNVVGSVAYTSWKAKFDAIASGYDLSTSESSNYTNREMIDGFTSEMWKTVQEKMVSERSGGRSCFPYLIRAAVRLYDGTYIYQSEPEFVNPSNQSVNFSLMRINGTKMLRTAFETIGSVGFSVKCDNIKDWSDIITSVVIAITPDIHNPAMNARPLSSVDSTDGITMMLDGMTGIGEAKDMEKKVLDASLFYKVDEVSSEDIPETGYTAEKSVPVLSQDELVVKERIPDDEYSHPETIPLNAVMEYNQRLILAGFKNVLCGGDPFPMSMYDGRTVSYKYFIRNADGEVSTVLARNENNGTTFNGSLASWIYYPDVRCFKVQMMRHVAGGNQVYEIGMKPHPLLNGAYAFTGFGQSERDFANGRTPTADTGFLDENPVVVDRRKVAMSGVANPFVFPAVGRLTFNEEVIRTATTTKALSEGQFGQYPVMIFTKGGIWAASLSSTGEFVTSVPVSREVAVSPETVTAIDDAIVFVSESGVKLMRGSDISEISPNMKGEHFSLTGDNDVNGVALEAIRQCRVFWDLEDSITDTTPFMSFMKNSVCAYDYKGQRLIFLDKDGFGHYQYVYRLATQTWHKMQADTLRSLGEMRILNSYPDVLMSGGYNKKSGSLFNRVYGIYDLGTVLDVAESQPVLPGIVITRAMDFDNDNVRKAIKDLRLRGHYAKGNVKYILMASNDGLRYRVIRSLQGCTYNLFRLVLLFNMSAEERFSYIDIDYETRFTDKLR